MLKPCNRTRVHSPSAVEHIMKWSTKNDLKAPPQNDQRYQTKECRRSSAITSSSDRAPL